MSRDQSTRPHTAYNPPAARHTPSAGYAPPPGVGSDYIHHPLHRVYTRKLRWVRMRWFLGGLLLGGLFSLALVLLLSALVYTRIQPVAQQSFTGAPDLTLILSEQYLNREATARLGAGYDTGIPGLSLRGAQIDLAPDNRLDLRADFHLEAPFVQVNLSVAVKNHVVVQDGKLVVSMVGDPEIGNLNVPLDLLPGDFKDGVRQAVDRVNNTILASELNSPIEAAAAGTNLAVEGVTTSDDDMIIALMQR